MAKDFKASVVEVKTAYDIVDYISASGVHLKRNGNMWKGLCPFHNEKTPSFTVNDNYQTYRCFGCGENGDILKYVMASENLEFVDALHKLADDKNIVLEFEGDNENRIDYKSLKACLLEAATFFALSFRKLDASHPAKLQVTQRGLSLGKKMAYGYAPEGRNVLYKHLKDRGYSDETILGAGVCGYSEAKDYYYDFWQGRLMFVICDITGKPIGFSGRKLFETDTRGKYVNSSEGPVFDKSSALFHINKAKDVASKSGLMYVTEGQFDVAAFVEADMPNVVASSGTAFTMKQAMIIRRLVTERGRIVFAFDGDTAGVAAAMKVFKNVQLIHDQAYVVRFPDGQDPSDYRLEHGNDGLREFVENNAVPMIEFILDSVAGDYDLNSPLGASAYISEASKVLRSILNVPLREQYLRKVALDSMSSVDSVRSVFDKTTDTVLNPQRVEAPVEHIIPVLSNGSNDFDEDKVIAILSNADDSTSSLVYSLSARIIALALLDNDLVSSLEKYKSIMPPEFQFIVDEFVGLEPGSVVIPELFTLNRVVEFIVSSDLFPLSHVMSEVDLSEQFAYLGNYLRNVRVVALKNAVHAKILQLLERDGSGDVSLLERAIAKEQSEFARIEAKFGVVEL